MGYTYILVGRDSFVERIAFFYGILTYIVYIDLGLQRMIRWNALHLLT